MKKLRTRGRASSKSAPPWFPAAGFLTGAGALLFFMYLIIRPQPIPCDRRFLIVWVMALASAMAFAFIGGLATARGSLPFTPDFAHVLQFSVGGGIAVLVIVISLCNHFYLCESEVPAPLEIKVTSPHEGATVAQESPVEWISPFTTLDHYLLVTWEGDSVQHVQGPPSRISDTRWAGRATFGESGDREGTVFFVSILAIRGKLQPGPLVAALDGAHMSKAISVKLAKGKEILMVPVVKATLVLASLFLLVHLLRFVSPAAATSPTRDVSTPIAITSPQDNAEVPEKPYVDGFVIDRKANVWIIVHPMETSDYWVQQPVTTGKSGKWEVQIDIGRPGNLDNGKKFEIRALANPKTQLRKGDKIGGWPEAHWESEVIRVFRK